MRTRFSVGEGTIAKTRVHKIETLRFSPHAYAQRGALLDPSGYDAGKKVKGRKRHILVDTLGLLLSVAVHPADIQDRDGAALVLDKRTRALFPFIERIFADGGYRGPRVAAAAASTGSWVVEIVKPNLLSTFVVLPKRWVVERTLAWISRNRRLARDFERYARTVVAFACARQPHCKPNRLFFLGIDLRFNVCRENVPFIGSERLGIPGLTYRRDPCIPASVPRQHTEVLSLLE
jgi:transposase